MLTKHCVVHLTNSGTNCTLCPACILAVRLRIIRLECAFSIFVTAASSPFFSLFNLLYCLCTASVSAPWCSPSTLSRPKKSQQTISRYCTKQKDTVADVQLRKNTLCKGPLGRSLKQPPSQLAVVGSFRMLVYARRAAQAKYGPAICDRRPTVHMGTTAVLSTSCRPCLLFAQCLLAAVGRAIQAKLLQMPFVLSWRW